MASYRQGFWYTIGYCHLRQGQRLFHPDRIVHTILLKETSDGVIFRCHTEDLIWIARFLSGLGIPFTILHPPELRTALREHALMLADYADRIEK